MAYVPPRNFPGLLTPTNCENYWSILPQENPAANHRKHQSEFFARSCVSTALLVASSVKVKDSFGTAVTNGPIIQPSPAGTSLERETTSLCTDTPLSFSSTLHHVYMPHVN